MDGMETLERIRQMQCVDPSIPVIALTANVDSDSREMYLEHGFTDFLSKPLTWDMLEKRLLQYLPQKKTERGE